MFIDLGLVIYEFKSVSKLQLVFEVFIDSQSYLHPKCNNFYTQSNAYFQFTSSYKSMNAYIIEVEL